MRITNKYLVETLIFTSYVLFAMAWVGGTASMNDIMALLDVDTLASASFLSGAVTLAKIAGTFLAAWLATKCGVKQLIGLGVFTPLAGSYEWLLVSRFLMGLGGAFMIVYFNPIVLHWFSLDERPAVNGINAVAFNVGTLLILWFMVDINALLGGWKHSLIAFALVSLVLGLIWQLVDFKTDSKEEGTDPNQPFGYLQGLKDTFNWIYAFTYSGLLTFYICLFTFYPKAGISQSKWVIGFGILGTLAGIIYAKRFPLRLPVIRFSGLAITVMIAVLSFSGDPLIQTLSAMTLGFFVFLPVTALVMIPHEMKGISTSRITVIFSLFYSISYLFSTIALWLFGKLVDINHGDYTQAFILVTVLSLTFLIGGFLLPETGKHKEVEPCEAQ